MIPTTDHFAVKGRRGRSNARSKDACGPATIKGSESLTRFEAKDSDPLMLAGAL